MNRRRLLLLLLLTPLLGLKACPQQQNLASLVDVLGRAVSDLIRLTGDTQLAERLRDHTNTAVTLLHDWHPGMNSADIIRALNRMIDDLNLFNNQFRPLVLFCLGTIAHIIEVVKFGGGGEEPHTPVRITDPPVTEREFRKDWDAIRAGSPGMAQVAIL